VTPPNKRWSDITRAKLRRQCVQQRRGILEPVFSRAKTKVPANIVSPFDWSLIARVIETRQAVSRSVTCKKFQKEIQVWRPKGFDFEPDH
jgi:hypothetical protein